MKKLEELREFIDELHIRIDYADYLTLIDYVDEIYGTDFIWIGITPEVDEEVLVTNGVDFMVDKWVDSAGVVFLMLLMMMYCGGCHYLPSTNHFGVDKQWTACRD